MHCWADLQSGHGLRCYGNITRTLVTSLCPSRDMTCEWPSGRGLRARTQNVSEYMLVLAPCLVYIAVVVLAKAEEEEESREENVEEI